MEEWGFSELTFTKTPMQDYCYMRGQSSSLIRRIRESEDPCAAELSSEAPPVMPRHIWRGAMLLPGIVMMWFEAWKERGHFSHTPDLTPSVTSDKEVQTHWTYFNTYLDYFCLCPKLVKLGTQGLFASFIVMKVISVTKAYYFLQMLSRFLSQCLKIQKFRGRCLFGKLF